ncbi:MAG: Ig-like domain-containing protein [Glaciecola sp.]
MKTTRLLILFLASMIFVVSCGGGSESLTREVEVDPADEADSGETETSQSLALTLLDASAVATTQVADGAPLTVQAVLTNSAGAAIANEVVTFVLSTPQLANFSNDTATALTDANGIASLQLTVGELSGSGTITASVESADAVTIGFTSSGAQQAIPVSVNLFASTEQLASSGGDQIELIAVVKNEQNILLPNIPVSFEADQDASLIIIDSETRDDGTARATLTTDNNKQNRAITVTANTSSLSGLVRVYVVGTEVNINGANSVIINDSTPITILLADSDGTGIANQTVNLSVGVGSFNGVGSDISVVTGANGQVTVNYEASQSGSYIIEATSLGLTEEFDIQVQEDDFSFSDLPSGIVEVDQDYDITLKWFKDNNAFAGGDITVTTSRGEISVGGDNTVNTVTTDANGLATITINSLFAGPASISAVGEDDDEKKVTARAQINFVSKSVDSVFVDATPDIIGPEGQTATITAALRDARGNLVQGEPVNFRLVADSSGGSISPNTVLTDSNGIASTVYTSNAVSSDNGVVIGAESGGVSGTTELTVGDRAFDIVLGTGNDLIDEDNTSFIKEFSVFVTDASGRPVSDASLTAAVIPTSTAAYRKGFWTWDDVLGAHVATVTVVCLSEDVDKDGILDTGEDTNVDGMLTPGNVATVNFKDNIMRTDDFGQAIVQVRYPQQNGFWSSVKLTVSGQSAGTESNASQSFVLPVSSDDIVDEANPPPGSPFGTSGSCSDTD